jgi:hypothetical protein
LPVGRWPAHKHRPESRPARAKTIQSELSEAAAVEA